MTADQEVWNFIVFAAWAFSSGFFFLLGRIWRR